MNKYSNHDKINKYLDELSDEYKKLLYNKWIEKNKGGELNISELLRIDSEIKKPLIEEMDRQYRMHKLISYIGICYSAIGIIMFLLHNMRMEYNSIEFLSLLITLVGLLIAFLATVTAKTLSKRNKNAFAKRYNENLSAQLEYQIITSWRDIEGIANDLTNGEKTISSTPIELLRTFGLISEKDADILRELLIMRNKVVHGGIEEVDVSLINNTLNKCKSILYKLNKIL